MKRRTVIALGFYMISGKLQLLQTSVNILYAVISAQSPKASPCLFLKFSKLIQRTLPVHKMACSGYLARKLYLK